MSEAAVILFYLQMKILPRSTPYMRCYSVADPHLKTFDNLWEWICFSVALCTTLTYKLHFKSFIWLCNNIIPLNIQWSVPTTTLFLSSLLSDQISNLTLTDNTTSRWRNSPVIEYLRDSMRRLNTEDSDQIPIVYRDLVQLKPRPTINKGSYFMSFHFISNFSSDINCRFYFYFVINFSILFSISFPFWKKIVLVSVSFKEKFTIFVPISISFAKISLFSVFKAVYLNSVVYRCIQCTCDRASLGECI